MHILIIEDQIVDQLIMRTLLEPSFEVTCKGSAKDAVDFALEQTFDVALINVMLETDMDCIDLLYDLQVIMHPSEFLAFAVTSHLEGERARRLMNAGFRGIIYKPFDLVSFQHFLRQEHHRKPPLLTLR
jgi:CheY-like chemotaxis protein